MLSVAAGGRLRHQSSRPQAPVMTQTQHDDIISRQRNTTPQYMPTHSPQQHTSRRRKHKRRVQALRDQNTTRTSGIHPSDPYVFFIDLQSIRNRYEVDQFVFLANETFAIEKKLPADETLTGNERLSETSQNLSLAITLSLVVAKIVGMLNCSPNSLHSANERF